LSFIRLKLTVDIPQY